MFARIVEFIPKKRRVREGWHSATQVPGNGGNAVWGDGTNPPGFRPTGHGSDLVQPVGRTQDSGRSILQRVAIHHQPRTVKHVSAAPVRRGTSRQAARKPAKVVIARSLRQHDNRSR